MKAIMFTVKEGLERTTFMRAIHAATVVIQTIYNTQCRWTGNDLVFEGPQEDYSKLYFWICGYGDCWAVINPLP